MSEASTSRPGRIMLTFTVVFVVLAVLALAVPLWIESTTGLSPDGGDGELEALLALPFGVAALTCGLLTWRSHRHHDQTQQTHTTGPTTP